MNAADRSDEAALREQFSAPNREVGEIMYALNAYSIVAITDRRGVIQHVNDRFCEISKYDREELLGQTHRIINSGHHPKEFFQEMWRTIGRGEVWKEEICNRAKDGSEYWVDTTIIPLRGADGRPERYVAIRTEETQRHLAEQLVHRLAYWDDLTGLPNRASMLSQIASSIEQRSTGHLSGVVVVSIDELSAVNDAFGYEAGDRLLVDAAKKLGALEQVDLSLARIGSNTFGLQMPDLGDDVGAAEHYIETMAEQIIAAFSDSIGLSAGVSVGTLTSVGYVLWAAPGTRAPLVPGAAGGAAMVCPADGYIETDDPYEVLKSADIARKRARRVGGHRRVRHFRQSMLDEAQQRIRLASELRRGIDRGELVLYSQPIVDRDRRVIGEEGLIRWLSPERGLVPPRDFIPLAEQTGIIVEIGAWVIEEACAVLSRWSSDSELADLTFSVNLSERQLRANDFDRQVREAVKRHGLLPGRLKLEITESALQTDLDRTIRLLSTLQDEGVASSLDDFGTGYSSLSYLQRLPVQQLKIDRSFVSGIAEDDTTAAIARTIVQLGRTFGLQIVAEGVETEEQFEQLRALGVDAFQGYLFSRPSPVWERPVAG